MYENNRHIDKNGMFCHFFKGMLYFFGHGENPLKDYYKKFNNASDADNIAKDWRNVGEDISIAYERFRSQAGEAAR